ncbi:putative gephyrin-like isoform X2 [Apostichopus japonicus]|uniref:Putative gephyrin-like isoform X2 n=1 Tax=Stichopus japonicus TaxID=307972 RepID=A0A2G8K2K3_STIJA|nr:putative gephyrin-like isoform X2 [Apostichopus japonicus]
MTSTTMDGRNDEEIRFGILTVSDRCAQGLSEDTSGPNLKALVEDGECPSSSVEVMKIVPDEKDQIQDVLIDWSDQLALDIILTTGGTGFARRDITPEATKAVIDKEANGISTAMLTGSLKITPLAMLGRPACGIRNETLIINLPGSKKGSQENFLIVKPWLKHAVNHLRENKTAVNAVHSKMQDKKESTPVNTHDHVCTANEAVSTFTDIDKVARRPRKSQYPLINFDEAVRTVMEHSKCLPVETIPIEDSLGRILSKDITANVSIPPFRASIKDGYAVLSSDGPGPRRVVSSSTAGQSQPAPVRSGSVVRITTGAMVPTGADAVVQVEDTELLAATEEGAEELEVKILTSAKPGQDIRPAGSDVMKGDTILKKGTRLGPSEIGLLASVGVTQINVYRVPTVAVLSTGNELSDPHGTLEEGHIFDSNRTMLMMALKEHRIPFVDMGIAIDNTDDLHKKLSDALSKADVIVTSGGVSMGEKDLLKYCLTVQLKAKLHFGRVLLKPGSSMVCFNLFVLPALRKLMGDPSPSPTKIKAKLTADIRLDSRPEFQRVQLVWGNSQIPQAFTTGKQISCRLLSMCQANALVQLPPRSEEVSILRTDDEVDAILIGRL